MVATQSHYFLQSGNKAPDFNLPNTNTELPNQSIQLYRIKTVLGNEQEIPTKGYLIAFICNHCPFVIHVADTFAKISDEYRKKGIQTIAISSNDVENYPDDAPEKMTVEAKNKNYQFPYLYDATQSVAKAYGAACTPDFFVLNSNYEVHYHGQFDDSRPSNGVAVNGSDIISALDEILAGKPNNSKPKPSIGCNIKWIKGNEPDYFLNIKK